MNREYELLKDMGSKEVPAKTKSRKLLRLSSIFILLLVVVQLSRTWWHKKDAELLDQLDPSNKIQQCPAQTPLKADPPSPVNLWASLTVPETIGIQQWLENPVRDFNLTRGTIADLSDNVVFLIEAYPPPKESALAYLEHPDTTSPPEKYARVVVHHGAKQEPVVKNYLVGPIPISERTTLRDLTEIYHRDIPFHSRGFTRAPEFDGFFDQLPAGLKDAIKELFGESAIGTGNETFVAGLSAPFSFDGAFRRAWITWRRPVPGPWLHSLNFYQYVDISGTDRSLWKTLKVVYNHQVFPSAEDFLEAFHNNTLVRLPKQPEPEPDLSWSTRKRTGSPRDLDHLPGPRSVSFSGPRFRVDAERGYVSWMGWGMFLGFDRDMGLSLWDIRFKGERIVYQLAPQEAIAQYTGNDPAQSATAWLDRYFGMGALSRQMLVGYDCPYDAVYLPVTTHSSTGASTRSRVVCVFEQDTGRPLTRHLGYSKGEFGAVRGYTLTLRSISTVGNYDYLFDYIFHLDGTIEVRLSASGYLQAGYWEPRQEGYGTPIRETTMGTLHDHVINYKVDLDVAGVRNSLRYTTTGQEEVTHPWFDDDWGQTVIQQKITQTYIENEDDALLKFPVNFQGGYAFVNKEEQNSWGTPRGYAIHPGYSPIHNTVVGSKRLLNNANWARYNLAVSLRKDTEPASSSMWNLHLPGAPVVDFHNFFDGENITQEDLVAWVNVGMHHLPTAEDAPNTRTNLATSSFFLTPLNYFDTDVSMESLNAILVEAQDDGTYTYDDYGVKPAHCIPESPAAFSYSEDEVSNFNFDGERMPPRNVEERRSEAEMYHRIKINL